MPSMFNEIVTNLIEDQDDMETSWVDSDIDLVEEKILSWRPDVLLLAGGDDSISRMTMPYLEFQPRLRVVVLTDKGRDAILCELKLNETRYESVSHESLIEMIRGMRRH